MAEFEQSLPDDIRQHFYAQWRSPADQLKTIPPFTFNNCPVTKWLSSEQKYNRTCNVFRGPDSSKRRLVLQSTADRRNLEVDHPISVGIIPGQTQLTVIPSNPTSSARTQLNPTTAAFEAE